MSETADPLLIPAGLLMIVLGTTIIPPLEVIYDRALKRKTLEVSLVFHAHYAVLKGRLFGQGLIVALALGFIWLSRSVSSLFVLPLGALLIVNSVILAGAIRRHMASV